MISKCTADIIEVQCPSCDSEAYYRYGKTRSEKQRFLCMICGRQFSNDAKKHEIKGKPSCPVCGNPMYLYKINDDIIRFRCSKYPKCKAFRKFKIKEEV
jgi:transposase-like protein